MGRWGGGEVGGGCRGGRRIRLNLCSCASSILVELELRNVAGFLWREENHWTRRKTFEAGRKLTTNSTQRAGIEPAVIGEKRALSPYFTIPAPQALRPIVGRGGGGVIKSHFQPIFRPKPSVSFSFVFASTSHLYSDRNIRQRPCAQCCKKGPALSD